MNKTADLYKVKSIKNSPKMATAAATMNSTTASATTTAANCSYYCC